MMRTRTRGERPVRVRRSERRGREASLQRARLSRVAEARRKLERISVSAAN